MLDNQEIALDTQAIETHSNCEALLRAMALACVLMAIFNSEALVSWVRDLPTGTVEDKIILYTEIWHEWMTSQGLDSYIDAAREYVRTLKDRHW